MSQKATRPKPTKANTVSVKKVLVTLPAELVPKLEHMRKTRGLRSRNELLVALCNEATVRENVL